MLRSRRVFPVTVSLPSQGFEAVTLLGNGRCRSRSRSLERLRVGRNGNGNASCFAPGSDLGGGVLVDAVEADQGVEDQEPRPDALHGLQQALAVGSVIETEGGHVDDGDVEALEVGAGGPGDPLQPGAHDMTCVLGGEQQDGSGLIGGIGPSAGSASTSAFRFSW